MNPQNGQSMLRKMLAKLSQKEGVFTATDDVSGVELSRDLMKVARQVEMDFVVQTCTHMTECQGNIRSRQEVRS